MQWLQFLLGEHIQLKIRLFHLLPLIIIPSNPIIISIIMYIAAIHAHILVHIDRHFSTDSRL